jgi:uncharacterized membrane protein
MPEEQEAANAAAAANKVVLRAGVATSDVMDNDSEQLMHALEHESDDLWQQRRVLAVLTLTVPIWFSLFALLTAFVWGGIDLARRIVMVVAASVVAGRLIILSGHNGDLPAGFSAMQLALLVFCMDVLWAIVLTWHAGILFRVPWIGPRLKASVLEGTLLVRHHRWMRNLTVAAVLAFVMLPVSSTGSIGGSLLGRLLGLRKITTLVVVITGSILGGGLMYLGAEALQPFFAESHPAIRYGGIAALAVFLLVLSNRYRRSMAS